MERLASRLEGCRVAVDVQHLHRPHKPRDQGSVFTFPDRTTITEGHAATLYAGSLARFVRSRGAQVLENDPVRGLFVGYYSARQRAAAAWKADLYLACHVNAGRGSYAAIEYDELNGHGMLAQRIGSELVSAFPEILSHRAVPLHRGDRGLVCVEGFKGPALLLEPFFGDNPKQQRYLSAIELTRVGEAIGRGIADWWQFSRPR